MVSRSPSENSYMFRLAIQPYSHDSRLGDLLSENLESLEWTRFDAAIAFVRRSGVLFIYDKLRAFATRSRVALRVGVDLQGTSKEGLFLLKEAVQPQKITIVHSAGVSTFHPKIYLFRNLHEAEVIIGSGNLTAGGLYTNFEGCVSIRLDLSNAIHAHFLRDIDNLLDHWSDLHSGAARILDDELLERLEADGYIVSENHPTSSSAVAEKRTSVSTVVADKELLFQALKVPNPPSTSTTARLAQATQQKENAPILRPTAFSGFVMTLQRTDVGVGQTTKGTSRRSPEIFIPLAARDYAPEFWGWPDKFQEDPSKPGKRDRHGVKMRLAGQVITVNMMTWPDKHDFRLRSEALRSAGEVGDILRLELADNSKSFEYYASIIPSGSSEYPYYDSICSNSASARNSKKRFGYY